LHLTSELDTIATREKRQFSESRHIKYNNLALQVEKSDKSQGHENQGKSVTESFQKANEQDQSQADPFRIKPVS
jgi:hypothetical protein